MTEIFPDREAMNAAIERAEQEIAQLREENAAIYERFEAMRETAQKCDCRLNNVLKALGEILRSEVLW